MDMGSAIAFIADNSEFKDSDRIENAIRNLIFHSVLCYSEVFGLSIAGRI